MAAGRRLGKWLVVFVVAIAVVAAAPFVIGDGETLNLGAAERKRHNITTVKLSHGEVAYGLYGPRAPGLVVLVHGFSTGSIVWEPTVPALNAAGLRVLTYDLYGRGFSDRPDVAYDRALFDRQLVELLDRLGEKRVDLVGLSMGGAIAVNFAVKHPERVRRLALISPAGMRRRRSVMVRLAAAPGVGEWVMTALGDLSLPALTRRAFHDKAKAEPFMEKFKGQMRYRGYKRALLSTLRHDMLRDMTEEYRALGRQKRKVLLIWGRTDAIAPFAHSEQIRTLVPGIEFHAIANAGHISHYERPEMVNQLLVAFFKNFGRRPQ
ncbi:MAG: alpha/beta fold hydrolase [Alphaproteobacteria bacterium]